MTICNHTVQIWLVLNLIGHSNRGYIFPESNLPCSQFKITSSVFFVLHVSSSNSHCSHIELVWNGALVIEKVLQLLIFQMEIFLYSPVITLLTSILQSYAEMFPFTSSVPNVNNECQAREDQVVLIISLHEIWKLATYSRLLGSVIAYPYNLLGIKWKQSDLKNAPTRILIMPSFHRFNDFPKQTSAMINSMLVNTPTAE